MCIVSDVFVLFFSFSLSNILDIFYARMQENRNHEYRTRWIDCVQPITLLNLHRARW